MYAYVYAYMYAYMYVYVCLYVYMCTCMCMCMRVNRGLAAVPGDGAQAFPALLTLPSEFQVPKAQWHRTGRIMGLSTEGHIR